MSSACAQHKCKIKDSFNGFKYLFGHEGVDGRVRQVAVRDDDRGLRRPVGGDLVVRDRL